MARSRAIDIRLERLVPAMEEYFVKGIFSKDELRDIAKQRTNHEYKLVARPLLYVDVRKAIDFELELEARVARFLAGAEVQIKNRSAIVERIAHIYSITIPCICKGGVGTTRQQQLERASLELQYLTFLKEFNRAQELSRYLASELQRAPSNVTAWVFSVNWELSKGNIDNARSIAQESLKQCSSTSPKVWTSLMAVETTFAAQLARGILQTDKTATKAKQEKKAKKAATGEDAAGVAGAQGADENDDVDDDDEQQQKLPLSKRYFKTNQALATIVVNGELVKSACAAALQSPVGGIDLLDDVSKALLLQPGVDSSSPTSFYGDGLASAGEMSGSFIAKYLFAACAKQQLDADKNISASSSSSAPSSLSASSSTTTKTSATTTTVNANTKQRNLNLAAAAIVHLIKAPFDYFFSSSASSSKKATTHHLQQQQQQHVYWSTSAFLDETPPACPSKSQKQQGDNKKSCAESLSLQTLNKLVEFSVATAHPIVVKATLQFAEECFDKKLLTKQQIAQVISAPSSAFAADGTKQCCPACQQAFDDCAHDEFDLILADKFKQANAALARKQSAAGAITSGSDNELLAIHKWITPAFKDFLEKEQNINIIVALAPRVLSSGGARSKDDSGPSTTSAEKIDDGASYAVLDSRIRSFLASRSSNCSTNNNNNNNNNNNEHAKKPSQKAAVNERQQLLQDINKWYESSFCQQQQRTVSTAARGQALFGSEAIAHQVVTMLLGRAILMMVVASDCATTTATTTISASTKSARAPLRRGRRADDVADSSGDDDDDGTANDKKSQLEQQKGFFDIISLFKLTQPTTPKQIEIRANSVALVASVWMEILMNSTTSCFTFPFVVLSRNADRSNSRRNDCLSQSIPATRTALATCASVLPPSISFLVDIAATFEFQVASYFALPTNSNNGSNSAAALVKMRQYFESAVAQSSKTRSIWQTWKQFEIKLGNLTQAGSVQRRASQALNDSRNL